MSGRMPSAHELIRQAAEALGYLPHLCPPDAARAGFNAMLRQLFDDTLPIMNRYEETKGRAELLAILLKHEPELLRELQRILWEHGPQPMIEHIVGQCYDVLRAHHLSVSQGRKARGGKHFEGQLQWMLDLSGVLFQGAERRLGIDLVFPDHLMFSMNPTAAMLVSVKRTLRERWEIGLDALVSHHCPSAYLATAETRVAPKAVEGITQKGAQLVVWDEVKEEQFKAQPMVLGYSEWVNDRLPVLELLWKRLA